jgi:selenocysteine-specific translation elongation factor
MDEPFKMVVDGIYWIEGKKGYLLSGTIESGFVEIGNKVLLSNGMEAKVKEFDGGDGEWAAAGDEIGILLSGIKNGTLSGVEDLIVTSEWK